MSGEDLEREHELRRLATTSHLDPVDAREELDTAVDELIEKVRNDHDHLPDEIIRHVAMRAAASAVRKRAAARVNTYLHGADKTLYELAEEANATLTPEVVEAETARMRRNLSRIETISDEDIEGTINSCIGKPNQRTDTTMANLDNLEDES